MEDSFGKLPNQLHYIIFFRLAGVRCTQIKGYVKGERCEPGDVIDDRNKSYWLAVYIGKRTNISKCIIQGNYCSGLGIISSGPLSSTISAKKYFLHTLNVDKTTNSQYAKYSNGMYNEKLLI